MDDHELQELLSELRVTRKKLEWLQGRAREAARDDVRAKVEFQDGAVFGVNHRPWASVVPKEDGGVGRDEVMLKLVDVAGGKYVTQGIDGGALGKRMKELGVPEGKMWQGGLVWNEGAWYQVRKNRKSNRRGK